MEEGEEDKWREVHDRTNMMWKRERTRKKGIMRTKITWNRERNTYTKVNSEGRSNMRQKLKGTTSPWSS